MTEIFFGSENVTLHGVLSPGRPGAAGVIICHPHPQHGGSMDNNVVYGVEGAAREAGFTALRFNFRGVGRSGGRFDDGVGEREDVDQAVERLAAEGVGAIIVAGYSFGAAVGLPAAAANPRVAAMAGVAPPTVMADFSFLSGCDKPKIIVAGAADDFCDTNLLAPLVSPPRDRFEVIPGADHFLIGREAEVGRMICEFIEGLL